jgi:hypothetical protein
VWFDLHIWTDGPGPSPSLDALPTYIGALEKLAAGAKHRVVIFELNANNHRHRRALANAYALCEIHRDGRIPVVCSANCLQPDGQNDNGWDQGLLFLNPSKTWLQPPGYVTQMFARYYQPMAVPAEISDSDDRFSVAATRSGDGKSLTLVVVNLDDHARATRIELADFTPIRPAALVESLTAAFDAANTAENPDQMQPRRSEWRHELKTGKSKYTFPPRSFVVLRFE